MSLRTPLGKVRGLGSAKSGTEHFWRQRITSVALIPLTVFFVWIVVANLGADHASAAASVGAPLAAIALLLIVCTSVYHMYLGMQVIIEDYVHGESLKIACLLGNIFFSIVIGLAGVFSILKLSFGS